MWKSTLAAILITATCVKTIFYIIKLFRNKNKNVVNKIIFFPDPNFNEEILYNRRIIANRLETDTSVGYLLMCLLSAKQNLDICVYMITSHVLADTVIKCHRKGVKVRVYTDENNTGEEREMVDAQIGKFRRNGIPIRTHNSSFLMHHKFAIIDEKLVLTGSLNWTLKALTGNCENVLITNEENIVKAYMKEFKRLWESSD